MSKKSLNLKYSYDLYNQVICNPNKLPFSFTLNNIKITKANNYQLKESSNDKEITRTYEYVINNEISVNYVTKYNKEFGEIEYYAYIENITNKPSNIISDLVSFDASFDCNDAIIRGNYGDLVNYYKAYENRLVHGDVFFKQDDGRTSHIVFPYFDLCLNNKGILIALGWAGTWQTLFTTNGNNTIVNSKTNLTLNGCLLPHEKIRTALVVLLPYSGNNEDNATNLWREWFVKYNMPKANANGDDIKPFTICMLANDTGLKNSDGSISESYKTWKPSLEKLIKEDIITDYRWIDAGWYKVPDGTSTDHDWWGSVGAWELDDVRWPRNTFKEAVDYCHNLNMKSFLWFEPERVTHIEDLIKYHNYKKEWAFETPSLFYNNIGNEECFNWTLNKIIKMMDDNSIDMYREDNNAVRPIDSWTAIDKKEEETYNLPRKGINENKCVLAHHKLWDMIIDYQKAHNKCYFVDSCAGGGGRNDVETLRKGIPMMRSDLDRGTSSMRLSQTSTLVKWIVFHGSSNKETDHTYKLYETKGSSTYVARASYLPIQNFNEAFTHNPNLDFNQIRRNINEWKEINHLLTKDFYRLTPFHHNTNKKCWTVFCYDDSENKESILLGFRMEECLESSYIAKLPYVNNNKDYEIYDVDKDKKYIINGNILLTEGIKLQLDNPKTSILLKIHEI